MIRSRVALRLILGLVTVVVVAAMAWLVFKRWEIVMRQRQIDAISRTIDANIYYGYELDGSRPPGPAWLRLMLGDNAFAEPEIECFNTKGELACLQQYPIAKRLRLLSHSVKDMAELASLGELGQLTHLDLRGLQIGDKELAYVANLKRLKVLDLRYTLVSDVGLQHLVGLKSLRVLRVGWMESESNVPEITDVGTKHIAQLRGLEELCIGACSVSDRGVRNLSDLPRLRILDLTSTDISGATLETVQQFPCLETLDISGTGITPAAVSAFRQSCPRIDVISISIFLK